MGPGLPVIMLSALISPRGFVHKCARYPIESWHAQKCSGRYDRENSHRTHCFLLFRSRSAAYMLIRADVRRRTGRSNLPVHIVRTIFRTEFGCTIDSLARCSLDMKVAPGSIREK